jgi:hypothetical protein
MKNIAVIMNTNEVGGAERSLVFQLKNQNEGHFTFFLPKISNSSNLEDFLKISGFSNIIYYRYPSSLYSLSRKSLKFKFSLFKDLYCLMFKSDEFSQIRQFDMVYLNGNKAAFLFFVKK